MQSVKLLTYQPTNTLVRFLIYFPDNRIQGACTSSKVASQADTSHHMTRYFSRPNSFVKWQPIDFHEFLRQIIYAL